MSDAPGDKPKPIFNPDDAEPSAAPLIDFGGDTKADAKFEAKADDAAAKADAAAAEADAAAAAAKADDDAAAAKSDAKAEAAAAKADAKAAKANAKGTATGEVAPAAATDSEFAGREVVYVQAPVPPRLKGNRAIGSLLAVVGTLVFGALFAGAVTLAFFFNDTSTVGAAFTDFIQNAAFWVPVLVFLVAFVLLVLIVNRAGWAAHVFGSLLVALAVYFGSIGILLLLGVAIGAGASEALGSFGALATNPIIIIAALVAREVSIWIGLAISARGRRVKSRNHEIVDEWEREHADTRAQYERASTT
ncbi:MAG: hypothetical protein ABIQ01_01145 [Pseudolysinimonas sp.]